MMAIQALLDVLTRKAFDYVDEGTCQAQISSHLSSLNIRFEREYRLGAGGIIDFYFPNSRLGLEVKANKSWSKMQVYRQLERYSTCQEISGLVLATGKMQGLPGVMNGKPVKVFSLGAAHL